jgi:hypothetical protein
LSSSFNIEILVEKLKYQNYFTLCSQCPTNKITIKKSGIIDKNKINILTRANESHINLKEIIVKNYK